MRDIAWVLAGFLVVWLALGAFLVRLWLAQRNLDERLERLEGRAEPGPGDNG